MHAFCSLSQEGDKPDHDVMMDSLWHFRHSLQVRNLGIVTKVATCQWQCGAALLWNIGRGVSNLECLRQKKGALRRLISRVLTHSMGSESERTTIERSRECARRMSGRSHTVWLRHRRWPYLAACIASAVSSIRLEKPHSLSYHAITLTRRPLTRVWLASKVDEFASWLKSIDTSG
nr:hypothetical protein BN993_02991 [Virgibacillus halodenitrificans]